MEWTESHYSKTNLSYLLNFNSNPHMLYYNDRKEPFQYIFLGIINLSIILDKPW